MWLKGNKGNLRTIIYKILVAIVNAANLNRLKWKLNTHVFATTPNRPVSRCRRDHDGKVVSKSMRNDSGSICLSFFSRETSIINTIVIHSKYFFFWLAKIPRIIHHNQLMSTKFGRILRYVKWWCQSCGKLPWRRGWVALVMNTKWRNISLVSRGRSRRAIGQKHTCSKNSKKTTRQKTSAIWRTFADLNNPLSPKFAKKYALSKTSMEISVS